MLRGAAAKPAATLINELVLRCQAQAVYSPNNIGHFGLALRRYAHFTSPIRRYADLIVHRALIGVRALPDTTSVQARCHRMRTVTGWRRSRNISPQPSAARLRPSALRSSATAQRCSSRSASAASLPVT